MNPQITQETNYPDRHDYNVLEHFTRHGVLPPGLQYITLDDQIVVNAWAIATAQTLNISLRVLQPDGRVVPHFEQLAVTVNGTTPATKAFKQVEGFLLSVSVQAAGGIAGNVYVNALLQRGSGTSDLAFGSVLLAGYPSNMQPIGYPQTPPKASTDGAGLSMTVLPANPAAGADYSITVPAGVCWQLRSFTAKIVTSAAGGNRFPFLNIQDAAGNLIGQSVNSTAIGPTTTITNNFANSFSGVSALGLFCNFIPNFIRLQAGWKILTSTQSLQAGDQWSQCVILVEAYVGP